MSQVKVIRGRTPFSGLSIERTEYSAFKFPHHFHDYYTVLWVTDGINVGFTERNSYKVGANGILFINPGDIHAGSSRFDKYLKFFSLRITREYLDDHLRRYGYTINGDVMFCQTPVYDMNLINKLNQVYISLLENDTSDKEQQESLTISLINDLMEYRISGKLLPEEIDENQLYKAKDFLINNYRESITLEDIVNNNSLSKFHLVRSFRKKFHMTPMQYLRNLRVEHAKNLLVAGLPVTQAALEVGFYDHSHLLRNFKSLNGFSPKHYI